MKRIVVSVQPFIKNQLIQVYDNDSVKEQYLVPLSTLGQTIFAMCEEDGILQVDIRGEQNFTQKIKEKILDLGKFDQVHVNVNLY